MPFLVHAFVIRRDDNQQTQEPTGWMVEAPLGMRPIQPVFMPTAPGKAPELCLLGLIETGKPLAKFPIIVLQGGNQVTPMLGRTVGDFLGVIPLGGPGTELFLFQDLPWPKTAIEAIAAGSA